MVERGAGEARSGGGVDVGRVLWVREEAWVGVEGLLEGEEAGCVVKEGLLGEVIAGVGKEAGSGFQGRDFLVEVWRLVGGSEKGLG